MTEPRTTNMTIPSDIQKPLREFLISPTQSFPLNPTTLIIRQYLKELSEPLQNVKDTYNSRHRLNEEEAKLVKEKKVSLHEMVNYKREILLSKIRIENKKKHMKDLEQYVDDLEKQINHKMDNMNKNTNIVRKNFHELKKDVEQLKKDLNHLESVKKDKLAELSATENEIYQRELEKRKSEEEAKTYTYYKAFILEIYKHFNTNFDEKAFRLYLEELSNNNLDVNDKLQVYLTENKPVGSDVDPNAKEAFDPVYYFVNLLETIEDDNFTLIYDLHNKEMNNFELDRKKPVVEENSAFKLEELEVNYQELLCKEKELREKLKESSQYEKEVLNEVMYSKGIKQKAVNKTLNENDEGIVIDMAEIKRKLIEVTQAYDLQINPDMTPLELLKILEIYFEKLNYDATLIANAYPEYYQRKLREHTAITKKDTHKAVDHKARKRQISHGLKVEERLNKVKILKNTRKNMQKYILKGEKKTVAKNDYDPEKFEFDRYFT